MEQLHWGILAPGNIAKKFADAIRQLPGHHLEAIGSRSQDRAEAFAGEFGGRPYGSYEEMVRDENVQAVYVASPHSHHHEHVLLALEAGKHVLCEKAFCLNAQEAREMVSCAQEKGLFLMEAMWMRFLPKTLKVREWLREGRIGNLQLLQADFGINRVDNPEHRLNNPHLGGGGLLDLGIYPLSLAFFLNEGLSPERVQSMAKLTEAGVDEKAQMQLAFPGGSYADLFCSIRVPTRGEAILYGDKGQIVLPGPFWGGSQACLRSGDETEEFDEGAGGNGFIYQAEEVRRCLESGRQESDIMPLEETIRLMELMDSLRDSWGLRYPREKEA